MRPVGGAGSGTLRVADGTVSGVERPAPGEASGGEPIVASAGPSDAPERSRDDPALGQQAAVLARLALASGHPVPTEVLIDAVWGEEATAGVRNSLRVHLSAVRKALERACDPAGEPWSLRAVGGSYLLALPEDYVDVNRLEGLVPAADVALMRGRYREADELAGQALDLWAGVPLEGLEGAPFAAPEAQRLDRLLLTAAELWSDANMALGRHGRVVPVLRRITGQHPYAEPLARRMMLALYRGGDQSEALRVFDQLQKLLAEELGVDPSPEVAALHLAILRQDPALLVGSSQQDTSESEGEVTAPVARAAHPLPWYGNTLEGRDSDVAAVGELLADQQTRMLTMMGPGGSGKTRLAVEVGRRVGSAYPGGVALVDCTVLSRPEELLGRCARALGESDAADPLEALATAVGTQRTLLIVDNLEHLGQASGNRCPKRWMPAARSTCWSPAAQQSAWTQKLATH